MLLGFVFRLEILCLSEVFISVFFYLSLDMQYRHFFSNLHFFEQSHLINFIWPKRGWFTLTAKLNDILVKLRKYKQLLISNITKIKVWGLLIISNITIQMYLKTWLNVLKNGLLKILSFFKMKNLFDTTNFSRKG